MTRLKIDLSYLTDQLKALLSIDSPTGYTDQVVRHCSKELERLGLTPELTRRGAIRAVHRGAMREGARAIVAHLDTIGAQVKLVKDNGRLELVSIGTWSARFAEGARVTIYSEQGSFRGSVLPLKASGHTFNEEVDTLPVGWPYVELRIDAVTASRAETRALGIDVGDFVAFDTGAEFLDNGFINARHRWTGHLWQGRFGAVVMDEPHLGHALRYVSLNPVRARLVEQPQDWRWSSVRAHLSGRDDGLVKVAPALERYGDFAAFLGDGAGEIDAWRALRRSETSGRPLGSDAWIAALEARTGRVLAPQKRGPKPRDEVIS